MQLLDTLYRQLFDLSPIALALNSQESGEFLQINQSMSKIFGYSKEEFKTLTFFDLIPEQDQLKREEEFKNILKSHHFGPYECDLMHKNGHTITLIIETTAINDNKEETLIYSTIQEISKIKKAEKVLNKAQELANIGHWYLDLTTNTLEWSDETYRIFGLEPQAFTASYEAFVERIHPDDRDAVNNAYTNSLETNEAYKIEHRIVTPQGDIRYVIESCEHFYSSDDGTIIGSIGTVLDITERKESEKALIKAKERAEAANLAKSSFIASMSHELRTPLNAILGFSNNMVNDDNLTAKHRKYLTTINQSGKHLLNMINEILDMSKIESGKMKLDTTVFDLHKTMNTLYELLQHQAENKRVHTSMKIDKNVPVYISSDESKIHQILLNLISNAVKFTDEGSIDIHVSTTILKKSANATSQAELTISVSDTGCGIEETMLEEVFVPFVQNDGLKKVEGGTGLGLAISKKLTSLLGGELTVESTLHKGSTFRLSIKVNIAGTLGINAFIQKDEKITGIASKEKIKVLVVDDIATNRILLNSLLEQVGYDVKDAKNADEAIEISQTFQPDFIWMDIVLGGVNGYEAAKIIKQNAQEYQLNVPVIAALTAHIFDEDREQYDTTSCDYFLSKPFHHNELFSIMKDALNIEYTYATNSIENRDIEMNSDTFLDPSSIDPDIKEKILEAANRGSRIKIKKLIATFEESLPKHFEYMNTLIQKYEFETITKFLMEKNNEC